MTRPAAARGPRVLRRIGVDFGGTKIEAAALEDRWDADGVLSARLRARRRAASPRGDYDASLRAVRDLVAAVRAEADAAAGAPFAAAVGVGAPGAPRPADGRMMNANSTWLNGRPFERDLAAALGAPVRVANDANCLALSEAADGAGAGVRTVFGVIIGTGVGGGLVVDGRLAPGASAIAGEWGHTPLPEPRDDERPGPLCFCGRRGCVETWISGPALAADYARARGAGAGAREGARADARDAEAGLSALEIAARAEAGEPAAAAALARLLDRAARALASVVNIVDPDVVALGGGLSNIRDIAARLRAATALRVFTDDWRGAVRRAAHGDSSGVRGAARLWTAEELAGAG